jgi:hypothetical protein
MIIVGGTYSEICFEPIWENIYGSGLRAVSLINGLDPKQDIEFHTCCDDEIKKHLIYYQNLYSNLKIKMLDIIKSPIFYYDYPLHTPSIFPRPDLYSGSNINLCAKGDNILVYGLLEAAFNVDGKKVVYDPQSPANPKAFSISGSKAAQLVTIINRSEAIKITGSKDISSIKDYFFNQENCFALIIKIGAKGALLFEDVKKEPVIIPVFQTDHVWPIGSGDVFSAYFAYCWFKGVSLVNSAINASKATALYCNSMDLDISDDLTSFQFTELTIDETPKGQIYLAGPFFTFSERWLVNEIYNTLKGFGLNVFSPFHDVGHGKAKDVVQQDLDGLDKSDIVFAIIDGLDPGTLFEVGYAISENKKVIAFVQKEGEESLKMLEGTDCSIERDLTTALYKIYWNLAAK